MKRQCAWCGQSIGQPILGTGEKISHGICPRCSEEMISLLDLEVSEPAKASEACQRLGRNDSFDHTNHRGHH
jgi:hypothetical protein